MLSPFLERRMTKAITVVKPKLGEGNYTFNAQLTGSMDRGDLDKFLQNPGFPSELLEAAISTFSRPATTSSSGEDELRRQNEELWRVVNEQRTLQKKTWEKYSKLKSGGV
jgi:pre-rRNA-processing protein IPI3